MVRGPPPTQGTFVGYIRLRVTLAWMGEDRRWRTGASLAAVEIVTEVQVLAPVLASPASASPAPSSARPFAASTSPQALPASCRGGAVFHALLSALPSGAISLLTVFQNTFLLPPETQKHSGDLQNALCGTGCSVLQQTPLRGFRMKLPFCGAVAVPGFGHLLGTR